jgi:hypothetical protein
VSFLLDYVDLECPMRSQLVFLRSNSAMDGDTVRPPPTRAIWCSSSGTLTLPKKEFMREILASGWNDLQDKLYADSWSEGLQRFRSPFLFRGLADKFYTLETTLVRLGGPYDKLELHLRNFKKYAHRTVVERDSVWNWLSVAQHHGLPTRLLDWTYSPLVAMHFATADTTKFYVDAVIWKVNYLEVHRHLPRLLKKELSRVKAAFDVQMLSTAVQSLEELDALSRSEFAVFFEPPSMDDRIVNQFALFSMMSSASARLDLWLTEQAKNAPWIAERIVIPAPIKWEIRDKLDQANITERVLFPGLDGLSTWLKRNYSPKTAHTA